MIQNAETKANPAAFQKSPDTILLAKRIGQLAKGEFISYTTLNALVPDRKLTERDRFILDSARNAALKESDIVTECVTGEGLKRLTDEEISQLPQYVITGIRRKANRGLVKTTKAIPDNMSNAAKSKWLFGMSALGAVGQCLRPSTLKRLEGKVAETGKRVGFSFFPQLANKEELPMRD